MNELFLRAFGSSSISTREAPGGKTVSLWFCPLCPAPTPSESHSAMRHDFWVMTLPIAQSCLHELATCGSFISVEIRRDPLPQLKTSLLFGQAFRRLANVGRNPAWERNCSNSVGSRTRVLFSQGADGLLVKRLGQTNDRQPEPAMNISNFAAH